LRLYFLKGKSVEKRDNPSLGMAGELGIRGKRR